MLIDEIRKVIPEARIRYVDQLDDPRNYRVNCDLIRQELGFKVTRRVPDGIREVMEVVRLGIVSDPDDQRFYNIPLQSAHDDELPEQVEAAIATVLPRDGFKALHEPRFAGNESEHIVKECIDTGWVRRRASSSTASSRSLRRTPAQRMRSPSRTAPWRCTWRSSSRESRPATRCSCRR